ncbi:MAG: TolC family protein [Candidatus Tectimicrobiota bacterium]
MLGVLLLSLSLSSACLNEVEAQTQPGSGPQTTASLPHSATEREVRLSLEEAVRLALQNNLDIERERLSPQAARTLVEQARAVFDPSLGLTASIGQTKTLPQSQSLQFDENGNVLGQPIVIRPFDKVAEVTPSFKQRIALGGSYELSFINTRDLTSPASFGTTSRIANPRHESTLALTFTQPLLKNFGIAVNTAPIRQAQYAEAIAQQRLLQVIIDTVHTVQQDYWELVFRIQDLAARRESQQLAEDFYAENKVRVELGALAPIELVQAETQAKVRQGEVISAAAAVREAEDTLKETLNLPEILGTWHLRLLPTDNPPFVPLADIAVDEKITLAQQQRPDVRQAQLDIASREVAREVARNQRLPQLDLESRTSVGGFGKDAGRAIASIDDAEGYNWLFGLRFAYPLGNRAANNELQRQHILLQQALIDQRKVHRTAAREIFQAVREVETASQRVEVTRAATVLARTQLEAEQEKFRLGLSTSFNVLQFQSQLTTARSDETRALSDYNVALSKLDRVTGSMQYGVK